MKFIDQLKISFHNLINNKLRSIITILIVYIISFLIMLLLFFGISYSKNLNKIYETYLSTSQDYATTTYTYFQNGTTSVPFTIDMYDDFINVVNKYEKINTFTKIETNDSQVILTTANSNFVNVIEMNDGNDLSNEMNHAIVSQTFVSKYFDEQNITITPGMTIEYHYIDKKQDRDYTFNVVVDGIFNPTLKKFCTNVYSDEVLIDKNVEIILNLDSAFSAISDLSVTRFELFYNCQEGNIKEYLKDSKKMLKELNKIFPKNVYTDSSTAKAVYNETLDQLSMYNTIRVIIIIFIAVVCFVLVLLSIGSLANTIMMSVDKNKKFIGLMKALGLKENDLKAIIMLESSIMIIFGIVLSFITLLIFNNAFANLNIAFLSSTVSYLLQSINYTITFDTPIYVPIIVIGFFIFFTYIFSKTSISKITKTDPIAVISEVA